MSHAYKGIRRGGAALALLLALGASKGLAQWTALPNQSVERNWPQNAYVNGKLYTFGGLNSAVLSSAQSLANDAKSWTSIANLPAARCGGYAAAVDGKIYIIGGQNGGGILTNPVTAIKYTPTVLMYDPSTNTYTTKASMPIPATMFAGAVVGGKIFAIGGYTGTAAGGTISTKVQVYDPATDTWSAATDAPYAQANGSAAGIGSDIYLLGGTTSSSPFQSRGNVGTVTGTTIDWKSLPDLPVTITRAPAGTLGGKLYVVGGALGPNGTNSNDTYVYDPAAKTWTLDYPIPYGTYNLSMLPDDGTSLYFQSGLGTVGGYKYTAGAPTSILVIGQHDFVLTVKKGSKGSIDIPIGNVGIQPLNGTLEIPADAPWVTASSMTVADVAPNTVGTISLTAGNASLPNGDYKTTVTFKTNDRTQPSIPITIHLFVRDQIGTQATHAVIEESSGAWCGPCGAYGVPLMRQLGEDHGEDLIEIAYHDKGGRGPTADSMATTETEGIGARLGVPFFPSAAIQRWPINGQIMNGTDVWSDAIDNVLNNQPIAPVELTVMSYSFDEATKTVTAKLKLKMAQAIPVGDNSMIHVTAIALEDSLRYDQYQGPETPFYHMHVARNFWPSITGQMVDLPPTAMSEDGAAILPGYETTVDVNFPVPGVTVPKFGHIVFLAHIMNGNSFGPILQGQEMALVSNLADAPSTGSASATSLTLSQNMPNPATSTTRFSYNLPTAGDVTAEIFTAGGARVMTLPQSRMEAGSHSLDIDVASLPSGVYSVRLLANGTSVTRMMTVVR